MISNPLLAIVLICVAWPAQYFGAGYIAHVLPLGLFARAHTRARRRTGTRTRARRRTPPAATGAGFRSSRSVRRRLRFYRNVLQITRWKPHLPEAGALFRGGFQKAELRSADATYLHRFAAETRRAEFSHWLTILLTGHFFLWLDPSIALVMPPLALIGNLPCILVQRYNRLRLMTIMGLAERRQG